MIESPGEMRIPTYLIAVVLLFGAGCAFRSHPTNDSAKPPNRPAIFDNSEVYSMDPADFDAFSHHLAQTLLEAWVVVDYRHGGDYQGELAESWSASSDSQTWTLNMRQGLTYENGEPIKPKDLVDSWTRITRVLKAKGSRADPFVDVVGYDDFPAKANSISGFSWDDRTITAHLRKPVPNWLDTFTLLGIYALAHPSLYDHETGRWLDPKKVISSGPYRVKEWDDQHMLLTLRKEYPAAMRHPRAFPEVEFVWGKAAEKVSPDGIWGYKEDPPSSKDYLFVMDITGAVSEDWLEVLTYREPTSPLSNVSVRRRLRQAFYDELARANIHYETSFYSPSMPGIHDPYRPLDSADAAAAIPHGMDLRFAGSDGKYYKALKAAGERLGFRVARADHPGRKLWEAKLSTSTALNWDIFWSGTRVATVDPIPELHFMVETTEGVCLPDPTAKAHALLASASPDPQVFNQLVWDEALIWPFRYQTEGWWHKPEVDFSLFKSTVVVPAISMMGWK